MLRKLNMTGGLDSLPRNAGISGPKWLLNPKALLNHGLKIGFGQLGFRR